MYVFAHVGKKKHKKDKPPTKEVVTHRVGGASVERIEGWKWGQKDEGKWHSSKCTFVCRSDFRAVVILHIPHMEPAEMNQDVEGIQKEIQTLTNELNCMKTEQPHHNDGMEGDLT